MNHTIHPSVAKFSDFVQLKDYAQPTKDEYVRYVRKLGEHYQCDPATLTEDQLRAYFLFLRQEKKFGGSAMKLARCALRSFFCDCLHVPGWTVFAEVRVAPPQTLPLVLSREQVAALLGAVQRPRYRTLLTLIYGTGLRVGEAVQIQVRDLRQTQTPHPRLHVRCGKGGKDRFVPLAPALVAQLRTWWQTHRHPTYLFPGPTSGWRERAQPTDAAARAATHLSVSAVQNTFRLARAATGLPKEATVKLPFAEQQFVFQEMVNVITEGDNGWSGMRNKLKAWWQAGVGNPWSKRPKLSERRRGRAPAVMIAHELFMTRRFPLGSFHWNPISLRRRIFSSLSLRERWLCTHHPNRGLAG